MRGEGVHVGKNVGHARERVGEGRGEVHRGRRLEPLELEKVPGPGRRGRVRQRPSWTLRAEWLRG